MDLFACTACLRQRCIRFLVAVFFVGYLFYPSVHHLMPVTRPVVAGEATPSRVHIDSCKGVLSDALLSKDDHPWFFVNGCTLHNYTEKEAKTCMRTISSSYGVNSIGILGDSRTRNFFVGLTKILGKQDWNVPIPMRHADFNFYDRETDTLLFMRFRGKMDSEIYNDYVTWKESPSMLRPRVIVQGNALWDLTFGGTFEESSTNFRGNLSKTLPIMDAITPSTDILWMLQDPTDERKMDATNIGLRGSKLVDAYNKIAVDLLSKSHVKIWKTARDVALRFPDDSDVGGIHYSERVIEYKVQLFLNWYCNRHVTFEDGTCCSEPARRNTLMFILPYLSTILVVFVLSLVVLVVVIRKFRPPKPKIPLRDLEELDYWKADAMGPLPRQ